MARRRKMTQSRILRSERGAVAIILGLAMLAVIGVVALGSEIVYLYMAHRQMQSAADSSALGGAVALMIGYPSDFRIEARAIAASAGYANGAGGTTVTVNNPPASGSQAGNNQAIEVIVAQPQNLGLVSLFRSGTMNVGARAVAMLNPASRYCMLALDPSASDALTIQNNAVVSNSHCGVAVDSGSSTALTLKNNAAINGPVSVHGDWSLSNGANLNGSPNLHHAPVIADPYAGVALQTPPACTAQSGTVNSGSKSFTPGHFCSGWKFQNTTTITLAAGAYYIDSQLSMGNGVTVNGTAGVTIIINGNYAINLGNNNTLNITAPSTGNYAGIAFFGLRNATPSVQQTFPNNVTLNIIGTIYFPNQIVNIQNNGTTAATGCTELIARMISVSNNVNFDNACTGTGVRPLGNTVQLVE